MEPKFQGCIFIAGNFWCASTKREVVYNMICILWGFVRSNLSKPYSESNFLEVDWTAHCNVFCSVVVNLQNSQNWGTTNFKVNFHLHIRPNSGGSINNFCGGGWVWLSTRIRMSRGRQDLKRPQKRTSLFLITKPNFLEGNRTDIQGEYIVWKIARCERWIIIFMLFQATRDWEGCLWEGWRRRGRCGWDSWGPPRPWGLRTLE